MNHNKNFDLEDIIYWCKKDLCLKSENGKYLSNENEFNVTKFVTEYEKATTFSYWDAVSASNLNFQLSGVKTEVVKHRYESTFTPNYQSTY